ncbi:putative E3 ubiquitin-protein ligase XBAT34 [Rhododendron vialii]|uniref:putative E3 ubiquitin-protein ligase XBAT34 n=1 Tax=Rhododendron vialii TaxID=182163 RepID=UPI00265F1D69|nr:putative E3 ubiquitin-protein ligase XBAT34 [Rhododendron vialii]
MGQVPSSSKAEDVYRLVRDCNVRNGNLEDIKTLRAQGAGLKWIDEKGRTPLILACTLSYYAAKTLIELGANVNAYCPGLTAGTPLHHAAKYGYEHIVKLLLSHGANPLVMNDDNQTPLDVARVNWRSNVVRAIESHICLFSGWLREPFGPVFLEVLAPQLLSRKVWVVVLPCGSRNLAKPFKLELAIYSNLQDSQPRTLVALWNANMEELKFIQSDYAVIISDIPNKTQIKLAPANETDIQQLRHFCNACKGIPQVMHPYFPFNTQASVPPTTVPSSVEDLELAMAINASIQSAMESRPPYVDANPIAGASTSSSFQSGWVRNHNEIKEVGPRGDPIQLIQNRNETPSSSLPSAPPIENAVVDGGASSLCVICLDAPVEGACIPCGHMVGCMSCLNEIKGKKWSCPVCRTKITEFQTNPLTFKAVQKLLYKGGR